MVSSVTNPPSPATSALSVEDYTPATPIAARVARHLDAEPPTVDAICRVADALGVPVERFALDVTA